MGIVLRAPAQGVVYDRTSAEMIYRTPDDRLLSFMTPNPIVIGREEPLDKALEVMLRFRFRHLPVVEGERVVGMLSDRDLRLATGLIPASERRSLTPSSPASLGDSLEETSRFDWPETVGEAMRSPVHCMSSSDQPVEAARRLLDNRIGAIPVMEGEQLVGILTETDFLLAFLDLCRLNQKSCDDLVRYHMNHRFGAVSPDASLEEGLERMDRRVGHLAVLEDGRLVGVLSERDLLVGLSKSSFLDASAEAKGRTIEALCIRDVMTPHVVTTHPGESLSDVAKTMVAYRFHVLPVLDGDVLVGALTQREIIEYYAHLH